MSKTWTELSTVNDTPKSKATREEKYRKMRQVDNFIRNTPSLKVEKLKENGDLHYNQYISENEALLDAFENKRLKSKALIRQAIKYKKDKAKAEEKGQAETQVRDPEPPPAE